jgi:hypothetical protein
MRWPGWASGPWAQAMTVTGEEQIIFQNAQASFVLLCKISEEACYPDAFEWYKSSFLFFLRKEVTENFFFFVEEKMRRRLSFPSKATTFSSCCCGVRASELSRFRGAFRWRLHPLSPNLQVAA